MKKFWLGCLLMCVVFSILAQGQTYQSGKVLTIDKTGVTSSGGGTDAGMKAETANYKVSVQVGDTVYVASFHAEGDKDMGWVQGKDVQVRISGKKMYVKKVTGKETKLTILSSSKATP